MDVPGSTFAAGGTRQATCVQVVAVQMQAEAEVPMAATRRGSATVHWQSSEQVAEAAGAEGVAGRQGGLAAKRAYSFPAALLEQPPTLPPRIPGRKWGRGSIGAAEEAQQLVRVKNRYAAAPELAYLSKNQRRWAARLPNPPLVIDR